jgi:hypothetical protein
MAAEKTAVLRVVVVKTDDVAAYLAQFEKGKEIMKKLGVTAQTRVWHATFAGPNAGSIVVGSEFPDMAALAEAAKLLTHKDYVAWLKSLDKLRTVISDSLYREL